MKFHPIIQPYKAISQNVKIHLTAADLNRQCHSEKKKITLTYHLKNFLGDRDLS